MIKFVWNGVKEDKTLFKAHYSMGGYTEKSGLSEETITIYAKDSFPRIDELTSINESDISIDYFESSKIRVAPSNKHYEDVLSAYKKQEDHKQAKRAKRFAKAGL